MTQSHNGRAFRRVQIDGTKAQIEPSDSSQAQFKPDGNSSIRFKIISLWLRLQTVRKSHTELNFENLTTTELILYRQNPILN